MAGRATKSRSLRVPKDLDEQIERERKLRRTRWTDQVIELVDEGLRMRRCPGVVFRQGTSGRHAVVEGTGIDVWAVVQEWQDARSDWEALRASFPMLSELQLRAALSYYELYPAEIDERLTLEAEWTPERLAAEMPFTRGLPG